MNEGVRWWLKRCADHVAESEEMRASTIGQMQHVTAVRQHLGVGLRELARRLNVSPSYLSKVENGECRPTFELNARLAKLLENSE